MMQLTLHATRRTPYGASRLVHARNVCRVPPAPPFRPAPSPGWALVGQGLQRYIAPVIEGRASASVDKGTLPGLAGEPTTLRTVRGGGGGALYFSG